MTIFLYELKKIFRPAMILFLAAISALVLFFALAITTFPETDTYRTDGTEPYYYSVTGHRIGEAADLYRTFDWFAQKYGTRIDDEIIKQTESLEYPKLDKYISEDPDFQMLGVKNARDYSEILDKYAIICGLNVKSAWDMLGFYTDEIPEEEKNRVSKLLFRINDTLSSHHIDYFIRQNELFQKYGIESRYELYYTENGLSEDVKKELINELERKIRPINSREPIPEIEELHTQLSKFIFCYRLRRLYEMAKDDPTQLYSEMYTDTYDTSVYSHARLACASSEQSGIFYEENRNRTAVRIEKLGDDYFIVHPVEMGKSVGYTTTVLLATSICASLLLAGMYSVNDNKNRVIPLQYSTKTGRKINKHKLAAVIGASVIVNTVFAAGMLVLENMDIYSAYYSLPLSSFASGELFWLNINMWQYIGLNIVFSYIVSAALSVTAYFICGFCNGNVAAIATCIPVCAAAVALYVLPFGWLFSLPESSVEDPLWLAVVAIVGIGCGAVMMKQGFKTTM